MPTYDWNCDKCGDYEIIKSIKSYTGQEPCPTCGGAAVRRFVPNGVFMGAAVQNAEYNPGLGCVVKNKEHRAELCKQRGLIEIGNEKPSAVRDQVTKARKAKVNKDYLSGSELWHIKDSMRK